MKYVIAPSILSADFTQLGKDIKETEEGGAAYLHLTLWMVCLCQIYLSEFRL